MVIPEKAPIQFGHLVSFGFSKIKTSLRFEKTINVFKCPKEGLKIDTTYENLYKGSVLGLMLSGISPGHLTPWHMTSGVPTPSDRQGVFLFILQGN